MPTTIDIKQPKVAAYTGTRNLYEHMIPSVKSLVANSDVDRVYLMIEDDEWPKELGELPDIVKTVNVSHQRLFNPGGPNMKSRFTYMAMMRATYAKLFPNLNKILSLDVDTIVVDDISDLWDVPLGDGGDRGYYFGAAREFGRSFNGYLYTNIGVAIYNLKKLRDGMVDTIIGKLNVVPLPFVEQDAFNLNCQGKILPLSSEYNVTNFTDPSEHPKIIHYAGKKEWFNEKEYLEWKEKTWEEVMDIREGKIAERLKAFDPYYIDEWLI